jgi:ABC-type bacteriocin/lantibiotic exporter with double-glycine peptidase domain
MVFWFGAVLVIRGALTVGTVVALSAYLGELYAPLAALSNARVELATSLVSFERVFEVLDLRARYRRAGRMHSRCPGEGPGHLRPRVVRLQPGGPGRALAA